LKASKDNLLKYKRQRQTGHRFPKLRNKIRIYELKRNNGGIAPIYLYLQEEILSNIMRNNAGNSPVTVS
jgi:hypothetical protein